MNVIKQYKVLTEIPKEWGSQSNFKKCAKHILLQFCITALYIESPFSGNILNQLCILDYNIY